MAIIEIDSTLKIRTHNVGSFKSELLKYIKTDFHIFIGRNRSSNSIESAYSILTIAGIKKFLNLFVFREEHKIISIPSRSYDFLIIWLISLFTSCELYIVITDNWFVSKLLKYLILSSARLSGERLIFLSVSNGMQDHMKNYGINSKLVIDMGPKIDARSRRLYTENIYRYVGGLEPDRFDSLILLIQTISEIDEMAYFEIYCPAHELAKIKFELKSHNDLNIKASSVKAEEITPLLINSKGLLFAESFRDSVIEQIKFSLSTKVWQYIQSGVPVYINAPANVNSTEVLRMYARESYFLWDGNLKKSKAMVDYEHKNMGLTFLNIFNNEK